MKLKLFRSSYQYSYCLPSVFFAFYLIISTIWWLLSVIHPLKIKSFSKVSSWWYFLVISIPDVLNLIKRFRTRCLRNTWAISQMKKLQITQLITLLLFSRQLQPKCQILPRFICMFQAIKWIIHLTYMLNQLGLHCLW